MPPDGDKDEPIAVQRIASTVTVVDATTGKETHKPSSWSLLAPAEGTCKICGRGHPPEYPHDAQSLFYQTAFHSQIGRAATWADAVAHCTPEMQALWKKSATDLGRWSEPPNGEKPVRHHGIDPSQDACGNG